MAHVLRGGIGDTGLASAQAIAMYFHKVKDPSHLSKYPPTRSRAKRRIVRGKAGAVLRGGYITPSGKVVEGMREV